MRPQTVPTEPRIEALERVEPWLRQALLGADLHRPLVIGVCGAQGSGKSTLCEALKKRLDADGIATVSLSLDDLYLPRVERERLSTDVHPLLRSRGVPGTHDVGLGLDVIKALAGTGEVAIPRFDKSVDDRLPREQWDAVVAPVRVILLEGWCVGACHQTAEALAKPVNSLEASEDADGRWRRYVNAQLAGSYQRLFGALDRLVLLAAPGFDVVHGWRLQQEEALRSRVGDGAPGFDGCSADHAFHPALRATHSPDPCGDAGKGRFSAVPDTSARYRASVANRVPPRVKG